MGCSWAQGGAFPRRGGGGLTDELAAPVPPASWWAPSGIVSSHLDAGFAMGFPPTESVGSGAALVQHLPLQAWQPLLLPDE